MKIQYLSDLHLEMASMDLPVSDADVVVLAGDIHSNGKMGIDWASQFPQDVIYVLGNHEFYSGGTITDLPTSLKDYAKKYPNVHVLSDDSIIIEGVAFFGCTLWTDFELYGKPDVAFYYAEKSINDYRIINYDNVQPFTPSIASVLHKQSMSWLSEAISSSEYMANVVVTHHLPTPAAIHEQYEGSILNSAFASDCSRLFSHGVTAWIYGHNHDCRVFEKEGIIFATNQRGYHRYENIADFDAYKVVEI
ncbi:Metallophosphoesterase [Vibrio crassostreae]|nr:Metallophosphoesterase [Vibrio crassostreae]CAK2682952.1 Metallophosphoesterase [Vibrio crassostreae]CAK2741276.1 Metallophosphoesterase [Vibrio crassostreae]CAK2748807.1 Metallophosphoesterase [Vibrio crassostreae]CAK2751114.1 Metallophosphoesterase [Vibrio crassostreae]